MVKCSQGQLPLSQLRSILCRIENMQQRLSRLDCKALRDSLMETTGCPNSKGLVFSCVILIVCYLLFIRFDKGYNVKFRICSHYEAIAMLKGQCCAEPDISAWTCMCLTSRRHSFLGVSV